LSIIPSRENRARRLEAAIDLVDDNDDTSIVRAVQPPPILPVLHDVVPNVRGTEHISPPPILPLHDSVVPPRKVKKPNIDIDACMLEAKTLDILKCRFAECNSDCTVRTRARDRKKGGVYSVRLGCKRVGGAMPCSLQIYCDVNADGLTSNIR
jgi:hypothetical protein